MTSKILIKGFIILLVINCITKSQAQGHSQIHEVDLIVLESFQYNYQTNKEIIFYKGQINLKDNEVFKGEISLNHIDNNKKYSSILKVNDKYFYIPNEKVKNVILYGIIDNKNSKTKFVSIEGQHQLFREIYKNNSETIVYDLLGKPFNGKTLKYVYIFNGEILLNLYNFSASGSKKDLINYINKRDNKKYRPRDFKTLEDLFLTI